MKIYVDLQRCFSCKKYRCYENKTYPFLSDFMDWCSDAFGADAGQLHLLNGYRCHKMDTVDHYHEFIDCREWQYYSPIRQQTFYRVGHRFHVYLWVGTVYEVFGELGRQPPFRYHGYGLCELSPPPSARTIQMPTIRKSIFSERTAMPPSSSPIMWRCRP